MPRRAVRIGALAVALSGCLDPNPKFIEPTASGGSTGPGTTGATTTATTTATTPPTTTTTETTAVTTSTTTVGETTGASSGVSTAVQPVCGDGIQEMPEECDDGPDNGDDAACTSSCTVAKCGDGVVRAGFEECDDGDQDPTNGCITCVIPRTCLMLRMKGEELGMPLASGYYEIDLDGGEPIHLPMKVKCDMDTDLGGWTVVERSPRDNPIGRPLFDPPPPPFNETMPDTPPYRMRGKDMSKLTMLSDELRIDCGGPDFLLAPAFEIVAGMMEMGPPCGVYVPVSYTALEVKGMPYSGFLCTGVFGMEAQCDGAWNISEQGQGQFGCEGPPLPWMGKVTAGANLFAVDAKIFDVQPPVHDCHKGGAIREFKLR